MRYLIALVVAVALLVLLLAPAFAQRRSGSVCGPNGCSVPSSVLESVQPVQASTHTWEPCKLPNGENRYMLYRGHVCVGFWDAKESHYRAWLGGESWGAPVASPPVPLPAWAKADPVGLVQQNHGLDWSKIGNHHGITINGVNATKEDALEAIAGVSKFTQIPDNSKAFRLTVIGSAAERKPVMDAWSALEPAIRDRIIPWSVPPDHFSLRDSATGQPVFRTDGHPTVYLQAPDGQSLHRQDTFAGPGDFSAIRKAVKKYDEAKDPDLRRPDPPPVPPSPPTPPTPAQNPALPLALVAIVGTGIVLWKRK